MERASLTSTLLVNRGSRKNIVAKRLVLYQDVQLSLTNVSAIHCFSESLLASALFAQVVCVCVRWQASCLSTKEKVSLTSILLVNRENASLTSISLVKTSILLVNNGKCFADKHFACQSRKMLRWQAFCLSITEKNLTDKQKACRTQKQRK